MRHATEKTALEHSGKARQSTLPHPRDIGVHRADGKTARTGGKSRRDGSAFEIGWLSEDPPTLAARIAHACAYGTTTVWVDDECRVHGARTNAPSMPLHWIVGIYTCGVALEDVVEDLCHERAQRERLWLLA